MGCQSRQRLRLFGMSGFRFEKTSGVNLPMALDDRKATIEKTAPRSLVAGVGRGRFAVTCPCGRRNIFDAFSWAGHGALRCKKCRRFIDQAGAVGDSRDDLK